MVEKMIEIKEVIKKLVPAGSDGEDLLIPLSSVISALQQTSHESICHYYDEKYSFGVEVDPAKESCWDGFVRIFNSEKIITKIISADTDGPMTLNDCLDVAKKLKINGVIYVIFADWLSGDMYAYGNYNDGKWHYYGRTGGFA